MKTSLNVLCYTSKTLSNGEHPIMICVNQNRKRKYSSLGISIQAKFWDFEKGKPKPNCPNRIQIEQLILKKTKEVMDKIARLEAENKEYSATSILGNEKVKKYLTVQELFSEYIEQLKQENLRYNRSYNKEVGVFSQMPPPSVSIKVPLSLRKPAEPSHVPVLFYTQDKNRHNKKCQTPKYQES